MLVTTLREIHGLKGVWMYFTHKVTDTHTLTTHTNKYTCTKRKRVKSACIKSYRPWGLKVKKEKTGKLASVLNNAKLDRKVFSTLRMIQRANGA